MCKLFAVTGIKDSALAWALVQQATPALTQFDKDGFGYTSYSLEKGLAGERWLNPKHAWRRRYRGKIPADFADVLVDRGQIYNRIIRTPSHNEDITTIAAHSRMATSKVNLRNVHPFSVKMDDETITLIHNGVVDKLPLDLTGSDDCDSMGILNAYLYSGVDQNPNNIQALVDSLDGSFACIIMHSGGERPFVDIFRNYGSSLHLFKTSAGTLWSTSEAIAADTCKKLKAHVSGAWDVQSGKLIRLCAITGEIISTTDFISTPKVHKHWTHPAYEQWGNVWSEEEMDKVIKRDSVTPAMLKALSDTTR